MSTHGYLYLIHAKGTRFFKLGVTQNLALEMRNIQNNVPFEIEEIQHTHTFFAPASHYRNMVKQFAQHYTFGNWLLLQNEHEVQCVLAALNNFSHA